MLVFKKKKKLEVVARKTDQGAKRFITVFKHGKKLFCGRTMRHSPPASKDRAGPKGDLDRSKCCLDIRNNIPVERTPQGWKKLSCMATSSPGSYWMCLSRKWMSTLIKVIPSGN